MFPIHFEEFPLYLFWIYVCCLSLWASNLKWLLRRVCQTFGFRTNGNVWVCAHILLNDLWEQLKVICHLCQRKYWCLVPSQCKKRVQKLRLHSAACTSSCCCPIANAFLYLGTTFAPQWNLKLRFRDRNQNTIATHTPNSWLLVTDFQSIQILLLILLRQMDRPPPESLLKCSASRAVRFLVLDNGSCSMSKSVATISLGVTAGLWIAPFSALRRT